MPLQSLVRLIHGLTDTQILSWCKEMSFANPACLVAYHHHKLRGEPLEIPKNSTRVRCHKKDLTRHVSAAGIDITFDAHTTTKASSFRRPSHHMCLTKYGALAVYAIRGGTGRVGTMSLEVQQTNEINETYNKRQWFLFLEGTWRLCHCNQACFIR